MIFLWILTILEVKNVKKSKKNGGFPKIGYPPKKPCLNTRMVIHDLDDLGVPEWQGSCCVQSAAHIPS